MLDSAEMVLCRSFIVSSKIRVDSVKTVVKTAADAESLDPDCRCHYQKPLEWCYGAVSSFLANPPGLGEV